jgi:plasmid replication initiation protein
MAITKGISRQVKKRIMSRIDTLRNRYDRINRLRNIAINERNILKTKQAQWMLYSITATLNLISQPTQWN